MSKNHKFLMADLFCGAGGSSTGAMQALSSLGYEVILTCCNHWQTAVDTHKMNHPTARHYCQDIATLRPSVAVPEGKLNLLMASPTCTYYSRARGGKPVNDQQRQDPWHVITWLAELRTDCLIAENVPEITEWGPVSKTTGKPLKKRKGEYFQAWVNAIKGLGFKVEWKILCHADYGDATTRRRFFLIARSDNKPIKWPEPTHFEDDSDDLFGSKKKWRSAREIIDWDMKGQSIFERKKPLASKTLERIMAGAHKFHWPEPFQVCLRQHMDGRSIDLPVPAITAGGTHIGVAEQEITPFILSQASGGSPRSTDKPVPTIVGAGAVSLTEPILIEVNHGDTVKSKGRSARTADAPLPAITTKRGIALAEGIIVNMKGKSTASSSEKPCPTITAHAAHLAMVEGEAHRMIAPYYGSASGESCKSVDKPLDTITTKTRFGVVEAEAFVISPRHSRKGAGPSPRSAGKPLPTLTAGGSQVGVVEAEVNPLIVGTGQTGGNGKYVRTVNSPVYTIVTSKNIALVEPLFQRVDDKDALLGAINHGRLVLMDGIPYLLDIRFRMLKNLELARATSLSDEESTYTFTGNVTEVTRQIGNAVPVRTARALVEANFAYAEAKSVQQPAKPLQREAA